MRKPRIAFFHPYFGDGGVERGIYLLAGQFAEQGVETVVLTFRPKMAPPDGSANRLRFIDLGTRRAALSIWHLKRYLERERPDCLVGAQSYANIIAIAANLLCGRKTRLVVTERVAISKERLEYPGWMGFGKWKSRLILMLMRWLYPWSHVVSANSVDGALDLEKILGLASGSVKVLYNPTFDPEILEKAKEHPGHPWFLSKSQPILIGVGRLSRQKDFETLLRAFAKVVREEDIRLVLLGDGGERSRLEALAAELGLTDRVGFPGFQPNPYAYLARADLFVLSSLYEGLPNALIEAVALGVPVVSTNCLSGPREILSDGKAGRLVEVGNAEQLSEAILAAIRDPVGTMRMAGLAREGLRRFESTEAAANYLEACLPGRNAQVVLTTSGRTPALGILKDKAAQAWE